MLKDITLGQYFPGNSILHKLDPRMKLLLAICYIVLIFLAKSAPAYALILLFTVILIAVSGISFGVVLRSLKPLFFVLIFTTLINVFWGNGATVLWEIGPFAVTREGIIRAVTMALRIILLMASTSVILMYTTSPISLTDGIERLLSPLARIGIPVHTFAMMMTMALRFIPTLLEETQKIINAENHQRTEGARRGFRFRKSRRQGKGVDPRFDSSSDLAVQTRRGACDGDGMPLLQRRRWQNPYDRSAIRTA